MLLNTLLFTFSDNGVECNVHLINNGLTIDGSNVMIEYAFVGDYTRCKLDDGEFLDCKFLFHKNVMFLACAMN